MGSTELPMRLHFERGDEYGDAIASLALARFVTGDEPFAQELSASGVSLAIDLVPLGSIVRQVTEEHAERVLARGYGWSVLVQRYRNGNADIGVSAVDVEVLAKTAADVRSRCPVPEPSPPGIEVEFWYAEPELPAQRPAAPRRPALARDR